MMTKEAGEAKRAAWLQHWQRWPESGERFAAYARRHELNADEGYRWRRILRRAGLLPVQARPTRVGKSVGAGNPAVARFARVRIESARQRDGVLPLRLQMVLANGRRADLVLSDEAQLPRILKLLESPP